MHVRMKEVALRAGVSTQTVSRVLRSSQLVTPETAVRVREAMRALGYHGNEPAGALKRGRTRAFGLLLPFLSLPFWSDVAIGAEEMAHARGYSLILCDSGGSHRKEADYLALLMSHRAVGIVYAPRRGMGAYWEYQSLLASGTPVVVISADPHDLPCTHVRTDDVRAGYVAVRHLLDLGRRRITLVCTYELPPPQTTPSVDAAIRDRLLGARLALREEGFPDSETQVILAPPMMEGGLAAGTALLASARPLPDGVFVTTDTVALGMLEAFRAHAVAVPGDCAIVSHDGLPATAFSTPALTTIAPPSREMGREAIGLLLRAQGGEATPSLCLLEAELLVRESTVGPAPGMRRLELKAAISHPAAWSLWRDQLVTESASPPDPPVGSLTLEEWSRMEVSAARRDPPRTDPVPV